MMRVFSFISLVFFIFFYGCTSHKIDIEVKPMHITIDVNVRIDRELENFFGNLDEAAKNVSGTSGTSTTKSETKN